jgi:hypothetical protein
MREYMCVLPATVLLSLRTLQKVSTEQEILSLISLPNKVYYCMNYTCTLRSCVISRAVSLTENRSVWSVKFLVGQISIPGVC